VVRTPTERQHRFLVVGLPVLLAGAAVLLVAGILVATRHGSHQAAQHRTNATTPPVTEQPISPPVANQPVAPPLDLGRDLTRYLTLVGDQVVTLRDGTYTAGTVTAAHPETSGPYKGWLVLVAQTPHKVIVDMTSAPLTLNVGSSRVLFVGLTFTDGTVDIRGDDIAFWYTEHTFPIEDWHQQFEAAGGDSNALKTMKNGTPKTIWIGNEVNGRSVQRTQILGADVHDVGDDGVYVDKSRGAMVAGTRIWNVDKKNFDPGYNPWIPGTNALIHNDGLQIPGSVYDFTMQDSYVGQTITVGGDNASAAGLHWNNIWVTRADGVGMVFYSDNDHPVSGDMRSVRAWSNGFKQNPYDPSWDQLRVDIVDGQQATWPKSLNSPRLNVTSDASDTSQNPPSGVTMNDGRMTDQSQALDSPDNPANVWRAEHPYDSWRTFFHFPKSDKAAA
jgi:hypothetical protein